MKRIYFPIFCTLFALILTACSAAATGPQRIASYPAGTPMAQNPGQARIYDSSIQLDVIDVRGAADRAAQAAVDLGGYLSNSQSWNQDGHTVIRVELAAPAARFNDLRRALYDLGTLTGEQLSSRPAGSDDKAWNTYSYVAVQLRASAWFQPPSLEPPSGGWNPGRTLRSAFEVFMFIFGFLADGLIWVAVVIGPFALMAIGLRAVVRRLRARQS